MTIDQAVFDAAATLHPEISRRWLGWLASTVEDEEAFKAGVKRKAHENKYVGLAGCFYNLAYNRRRTSEYGRFYRGFNTMEANDY